MTTSKDDELGLSFRLSNVHYLPNRRSDAEQRLNQILTNSSRRTLKMNYSLHGLRSCLQTSLQLVSILPGVYSSAHTFRANGTPVRAARLHERALMHDMLVTVPTLGRYLGTINIHEDLIVDEAAGTTEILVIADRAKNGIGTCAELPVDLVEHFKQHVVNFRPYLKGSESDWLFPSRNGGPRTPHSIRLSIGPCLMEACGS